MNQHWSSWPHRQDVRECWKKKMRRLPGRPRAQGSVFPLQGTQVWSPGGELRSHMLCSATKKKKKNSENAYSDYDTGRVYIAVFPVRDDLLVFWVPACISSVLYPFSGIWVQHPRQTVHRMEPDCPEAGVSSSLAPKGHSHHTHQFSSQETNAHPPPRHLHVLPHRQVIGESFTTASCTLTGFCFP